MEVSFHDQKGDQLYSAKVPARSLSPREIVV